MAGPCRGGVHRLHKSGRVLHEGYSYGGSGVCLGDSKEACLEDMGMAGLGDGQTGAYLKDTGMTGLATVWAVARRRPMEYRHKVDAATR